MKNNFNLDELEEFLSDSADLHRMYPSDKVWRNIHKEMHGYRRWPALTFAAILTGAVIMSGLILIHPDKSLFSVDQPKTKIPGKLYNFNETKQPAITPSLFSVVSIDKHKNDSYINRQGKATSNEVISSGYKNSINPNITSEILETTVDAINADPSELVLNSIPENLNQVVESKNTNEEAGKLIGDPSASYSRKREFANKASLLSSGLTFSPKNFGKDQDIINKASFNGLSAKKSRWSSFFYVTPSISYRYLAEAKVVDLHTQNGPVIPNYVHDVNNYVRHNPIAGLELGGGLMYKVSPSVRIRMGLQANTRGYSIDAYANRTQVSTLVLNRGFYTDSVAALSNISNFSGYQAINIKNRYFELSAPVSLDLKLAGKKKLEFYAGVGLQPTYQFNQNMYIVSSDYKNYIQQPDLARHFNINTSLEAFLSYKTGKLTWQAGPQLRYQMLSGTNKAYPVKEHLFDYGLKIGVVKSIR